ncbi:hypothetical protein I4U23_006391 [Adineta vaga]|nr:hypothetical protein I4U23_006391 [Adineta vaga]
MVVGKIAIAVVGIIIAVFAIGATIVISLISIYIPNQSVSVSGIVEQKVVSKMSTVASNFATTVTGPVANITATTGVTASYAQFSAVSCPGTMTNGICTWQRKLAVTCIDGSTVRIRVQSNEKYLSTMAGISIDNVVILNVNSGDSADPFYPPTGYEQEGIDSCLSHPQASGVYHYHVASGCAVSPPVGNITSCGIDNSCITNVAGYMISTWPSSAKKLTVIGIAKDGHVIYGPYLNTGELISSGVDICNGMFYDSIGNYAYFATTKYPYITGCFGPGNYPSFGPTCTTNGQSSYTMSKYAAVKASG